MRTLTGHEYGVNNLAFSPDGTLLTSASDDESARIWRVSDGAFLHKLVSDPLESIKSVAFSSDGALLAAKASYGVVRFWSISDGKLMRVLRGHKDLVNAMAFSPNRAFLASGSYDETVRLCGWMN